MTTFMSTLAAMKVFKWYLRTVNYLAHIYLSGAEAEVRFGNFIGDDVKGKKFEDYPIKIKKGILLHRRIDSYTDSHAKTLEVLKLLYPRLGKLAGVALDIYSDHFLAKNWTVYSQEDLMTFSVTFFEEMEKFRHLLPSSLERLFFFMKRDNWLFHYQFQDRLSRTFEGMVKRYPFANSLKAAAETLEIHYDELEEYFTSFFPELQSESRNFLTNFSVQ